MEEKYLKYKLKYFQYKSMTGGTSVGTSVGAQIKDFAASTYNKGKKLAASAFNEIKNTIENPDYMLQKYLPPYTLYKITILSDGKSATIIATQSSKIGEVKMLLKCISKTIYYIDDEEYTVKDFEDIINKLAKKLVEKVDALPNCIKKSDEEEDCNRLDSSVPTDNPPNSVYHSILKNSTWSFQQFKNELYTNLRSVSGDSLNS